MRNTVDRRPERSRHLWHRKRSAWRGAFWPGHHARAAHKPARALADPAEQQHFGPRAKKNETEETTSKAVGPCRHVTCKPWRQWSCCCCLQWLQVATVQPTLSSPKWCLRGMQRRCSSRCESIITHPRGKSAFVLLLCSALSPSLCFFLHCHAPHHRRHRPSICSIFFLSP